MTRYHWILLAILLLPVGFSAGHQLMDVDPAQYGDVARHMVEKGLWLDLHHMNGPFVNKPPLAMWLEAFSMLAFGVNAFAARLPSILLGLVLLWTTFRLGRAMWSAAIGANATLFVAASPAFHLMIADPKVDLALATMTSLAIMCVVDARMVLAWSCAALGVLSKGPLGVAIPVLALTAEMLRNNPHNAPRFSQRLRQLRPLWGIMLVVAICAPFYVTMSSKNGPQALKYLLWSQSFGQLNDTSGFRTPGAGPFFYVHTMLWAFAPFSLLTVFAMVRAAVQRVKERSFPAALPNVPWWWFGSVFVVISMSAYKLPQYLYWLVVPAALIAARELERAMPAARRWIERAAWMLLFAVAAVIVACAIWCFPSAQLWAASVVVGFAFAGFAMRSALSAVRTPVMIAAVSVSVWWFFHGAFHRELLRYQPFDRIGERARAEAPAEDTLQVMGIDPVPYSLGFAAQRRPVAADVEAVRALAQTGPTLVVVSGQEALAQLRAALQVDVLLAEKSYPVSRPRFDFLVESRRAATLSDVWLVRASVAAQ